MFSKHLFSWLLLVNLDFSSLAADKVPKWDSKGPYEQEVGSSVKEIAVKDILEDPLDYAYAGGRMSDPFSPPSQSAMRTKVEIPVMNALQNFNTEVLSLVGIWLVDKATHKALITTPKGEGVVVAIGDPIGNRGGKILEIFEKFLIAREFVLAPDGTRLFQDKTLWLASPPKAEEEVYAIPRPVYLPEKSKAKSASILEKKEVEESNP